MHACLQRRRPRQGSMPSSRGRELTAHVQPYPGPYGPAVASYGRAATAARCATGGTGERQPHTEAGA